MGEISERPTAATGGAEVDFFFFFFFLPLPRKNQSISHSLFLFFSDPLSRARAVSSLLSVSSLAQRERVRECDLSCYCCSTSNTRPPCRCRRPFRQSAAKHAEQSQSPPPPFVPQTSRRAAVAGLSPAVPAIPVASPWSSLQRPLERSTRRPSGEEGGNQEED